MYAVARTASEGPVLYLPASTPRHSGLYATNRMPSSLQTSVCLALPYDSKKNQKKQPSCFGDSRLALC